jgi:antibiotic biosynthesis monooxygenase (ABM) superfamily enzyme
MSSEPELPAARRGPVTATITRRVKPGREAAYEEFLAGIRGAAKAFPGISAKRSSGPPAAKAASTGSSTASIRRPTSAAGG